MNADTDPNRLLTEADLKQVLDTCAEVIISGMTGVLIEVLDTAIKDPRIESMPGDYGRGLRAGLKIAYDIINDTGTSTKTAETETPHDT